MMIVQPLKCLLRAGCGNKIKKKGGVVSPLF